MPDDRDRRGPEPDEAERPRADRLVLQVAVDADQHAHERRGAEAQRDIVEVEHHDGPACWSGKPTLRRSREGPGRNASRAFLFPLRGNAPRSAWRAACLFAGLSPIVCKTRSGRIQDECPPLCFSARLVLSLVATAATAQDYPTKPITIVSAAGAAAARATPSAAWSPSGCRRRSGQPVLIENRPGASGNVGAAAVARAAPDGYTLMIGTDAMMTSNVHLFKSMPFDPVKDFAPITNGGANIIVLAVHADLPVKIGAGADRPRQGQSRQAAVRLLGRRVAASSGRRVAEAQDRHRHRARALSRRRACRRTIWSAAISRWRF